MTAQDTLLSLWAEIEDLGSASALLEWDQETQMPKKGQEGRGRALATLAGISHAKMTAPELSDALGACAEEAEPGSDLEALVRLARRDVARATRIPTALAKRMAEAQSRGLAAWQRARREDDFSLFAVELAELVAIKREIAGLLVDLTPTGNPYDALLDEYEPGSTEAQLTPLFASLRAELAPLVKGVAESGVRVDETPAQGVFPEAAQLAFGRRVAEAMGFDFDAGRIDLAAHPFCTGFNPRDVRLTWRYQEDDFRPALYGIMHEAGHGLYEQGLPAAWERSPLGKAVSLGVHESQSRLWENLVGRSRAFWEWALPLFHEHFPDKKDVGIDDLWPALHTVTPSLIRVEADEATYNLHVCARFEIEAALFRGDLEVPDLPEAWDARYEDLLGIRAPSVADGVLQDIHWSMGAFGYFPTYTLGNLMNSQLFARAAKDLGDLDALFAAGDFRPLLTWLRDNVHGQGSRWSAGELIERATGEPLSPEPFLTYIRQTTEAVYGVKV